MAETSKNKIYYNDNENSVADVLADMKKMAESTDKAIENSKYNDEAIKKNISDIEEKQSIKDSKQDSKIVELQTEKAKLETELKEMQEDFYQNSIRGQARGEYIHVEDSSNCRAKIGIGGNSKQETSPSPDYPSEVKSCGDNGSINEVICNKNIFDKNNPQYLDGYGLNTTGFFARGDQRTYIIPVPQNKENITVSYTKNLTGSRYYAFADEIPTGANSSHYDRVYFANSYDIGKITFTAKNNNYKYLLLGSTKSEVFTDLQVEQNPTATSYEEHKEQTYIIPTQQPMRAIGDIRDTFIKKNNKWYERHYINRLILNGTESWDIIGTNTTGKYRFQTKVSPNEIVNNQDGDTYMQGFCNRLIMGTPNTTYLCQTGITTISGYLIIYNEKATDTIDNFKAWLSSNNLTVDYLLKTPLDIECTEEQSNILDELNNARTYKNVTNIYSTDEISPIIDLDYAKDLETLLTSKESEV